MAWPMIESVLDGRYASLHGAQRLAERSVIVFGSMEATLTPLMEAVEAEHPGVRVFSLPSVDHPQWGRHIELGVKGQAERLDAPFRQLRDGALALGAQLGPEMVR
jgi:molybdopterin-biosynthesis enzyme MoeA-like protein